MWHWIELLKKKWPSIAGSSSRAPSPPLIISPRPLILRRWRPSRGRVPPIPIRRWRQCRWWAHAAPPLVLPIPYRRRGPVPLVVIGSALSLSLTSSQLWWRWCWRWCWGLLGWLFGGFFLAVTAAVHGLDRHVHDLGHGRWSVKP